MKKKHSGLKVNRHKTKAILLIVLIILIVFTFTFAFLKSRYSKAELIQNKNIEIIDKTMPEVSDKGSILGNKDDLISFSIIPGAKVNGLVSYRGSIKGGYFFEGNILINVLDSGKKVLIKSNAVASTDWMTEKPVEFEGYLDLSNTPNGKAYIEIHNDNASGLPENDKSILIPIIIE